jgi:hypothetical protein
LLEPEAMLWRGLSFDPDEKEEDENKLKGPEAVKQKVDSETGEKALETLQVEEALNGQGVQSGKQQLRLFFKV